ncbi:MAG: TetR/AcrR family transcriptional regulator [Ruminococcus sp.]|nr:TetR/AcrR family transcriptional regulator [Ruminococcus sp.]
MGKTKETKQEIMKVTKQLILEKGYAQVTMNDVTQASGMSAGGLYYHYRTVGDIVKEILTAETNNVWESIGSPKNPQELIDTVRIYLDSEKHELMDYKNSLNWVLYEYYFSFPREQRETLLKQQHEKTADMLRNILSPFICDNDRLDILINSICIELLGLTMLSMTGGIEEKIIDSRFENMLSEIRKNTEQEN